VRVKPWPSGVGPLQMVNMKQSDVAHARIVLACVDGTGDRYAIALRRSGATVSMHRVLTAAPPIDLQPFDAALRSLASFDWLVLTSANSVRSIAGRAVQLGLDAARERPRHIAVVGRATSKSLDALAWNADLMPERPDSDSLLAAMVLQAGPVSGQTLLLPQSALAGSKLAISLRRAGFQVTLVTAYRLQAQEDEGRAAARELAVSSTDVVFLTSPSVVRAVCQHLANRAGLPPAVCLGMPTAEECRRQGFTRIVVADQVSTESAIVAVAKALGRD
jgi:uroporphyrinogen-III synthase